MKKLLISFSFAASLLLASLAVPYAGAQAPNSPKTSSPKTPSQKTDSLRADWQKIPIPPLPAFHPQQPRRIDLPNGMIIFLQEDHELPLIDGSMRIRGGSISEQANKAGLLDIYSEVWRTGGTKSQTGDQLDDFLEARAAKVETNDAADSTTISFSCLKEDFDDVFSVFNQLLRQPEFRAEKLDLAQKEMNDAISRRNDDASGIAQRESAKLAYGADNPYVRQPEYATVAAITREDLVNWHNAHVYPNRIILGIVGDFDSAAMETKLRAAFGDWAKGPDWQKPEIDFRAAKPGYYLIPKDDVNQSSIDMVELGIQRENPDYYAAQVFNQAFGGGFSSRLFKNIRTAQGLAYDVGGGIGSAFDHPGVVRFEMATKSVSTVQAIQAIYKEIDDLPTHPITDEEIKSAKDSILNTFVFRFDSPAKILSEQMTYAFYGFPADYLDRYRSAIEKVTKEQVAQAAAKYVHKDQLAVLVVGNTADFDKPLSTLGSVTNVDITIPPPASTAPEQKAPAASNPEGKALALKVAQALGGLDKIKTVKSVRTVLAENEMNGSPVPIDVTIVYPDKMHVSIPIATGTITVIVTPTLGMMSAENGGTRDLGADQKKENSEQIRRDLLFLAQHADDPSFVFAAAGTEKIGDGGTNIDAAIVDVSGAGVNMRWYVNPATGRVLRETYVGMGQSGTFQGETDFSDWTTTNGITLPATHMNKQDGKESSTVKTTSIEFNPTIDPKLFEKPAANSKPAQ
ncbi:MAG: pitrilysin family protein [Terriglobales bacterium]